MYIGCTQPYETQPETMNEFVHKLADELIDWRITTRAQRSAYQFRLDSPPTRNRSIDIVHLMPTKRFAPTPTSNPSSERSSKRIKSYCRECKNHRGVYLCSHCTNPEIPICHTNHRHECWSNHCERYHANEMCNMPLAASSASRNSQGSSQGSQASIWFDILSNTTFEVGCYTCMLFYNPISIFGIYHVISCKWKN